MDFYPIFVDEIILQMEIMELVADNMTPAH